MIPIKKCLLMLFFLLKMANPYAQTRFEPGDIAGLWQCTKSGYDILLEISGENGIVRSVGTAKLPKSIVG